MQPRLDFYDMEVRGAQLQQDHDDEDNEDIELGVLYREGEE